MKVYQKEEGSMGDQEKGWKDQIYKNGTGRRMWEKELCKLKFIKPLLI